MEGEGREGGGGVRNSLIRKVGKYNAGTLESEISVRRERRGRGGGWVRLHVSILVTYSTFHYHRDL